MLICNLVQQKELLNSSPTVQESGQSEQYTLSYAFGQIRPESPHATHIPMKSPLVHGAQGTVVRELTLSLWEGEVTGSNPSSGQILGFTHT